jgi:hypothetical protein
MPTTKGKCESKVAHKLFFKNAKDDKQCSSSTLPRTWTMAIYTNLGYSRKECVKARDALMVLQMQVNGLRSNGGSMANLELLFV